MRKSRPRPQSAPSCTFFHTSIVFETLLRREWNTHSEPFQVIQDGAGTGPFHSPALGPVSFRSVDSFNHHQILKNVQHGVHRRGRSSLRRCPQIIAVPRTNAWSNSVLVYSVSILSTATECRMVSEIHNSRAIRSSETMRCYVRVVCILTNKLTILTFNRSCYSLHSFKTCSNFSCAHLQNMFVVFAVDLIGVPSCRNSLRQVSTLAMSKCVLSFNLSVVLRFGSLFSLMLSLFLTWFKFST